MGGEADQLKEVLADGHDFAAPLADAFALALRALSSDGGNGTRRELTKEVLEVAVLERARPGRAFRRIEGLALDALLARPEAEAAPEAAAESDESPETDES